MGYKINPCEHTWDIELCIGNRHCFHLENFTYGLQLIKKKVTFPPMAT